MNQQVKDKICKQIDNEIEKISNMASLNDVTLSQLYKLIDIKKDILEIDEKEMELGEPMMNGNSFRSGYARMGNSYQQGRVDNNSNRYMYEPVYANSYDGGYSMAGSDAYAHLEQAMRSARTENEREAIRQAMSKMHM